MRLLNLIIYSTDVPEYEEMYKIQSEYLKKIGIEHYFIIFSEYMNDMFGENVSNVVTYDNIIYIMTRTTTSDVIYKVEEVKNIMHENIEKAAENCVKLESINIQAEELMVDAGVFQTNAKKLRDKLWWQNMKLLLSGVFVILIIIGVIIARVESDNKN